MRKTILLLTLILCAAGVTASAASAHTCTISNVTLTASTTVDYMTGVGKYACGTGTSGSVTQTVSWQKYTGFCHPLNGCTGGSWVALTTVSSCSSTVTRGTGTFTLSCTRNFLDKADAKCVRAKFTLVHVVTTSAVSSCILTEISA